MSLCITSGLLIFFNKIKTDLASFWILGANQKQLRESSKIFLVIISIFSTSLGILSAFIFLQIFDHYAPNIMPDIFVDRKIPIYITAKGIFISFIVPTFISVAFSYLTLGQFTKDEDSLFEQIRKYG